LRQQNTGPEFGKELRSDSGVLSRSDGIEEKELETLLHRQQQANSPRESLLRTMCSVDTKSAARLLKSLRSGAYDEALKPKSSATQSNSDEVEEYPWEGGLHLV
jgi:hypothetical protein